MCARRCVREGVPDVQEEGGAAQEDVAEGGGGGPRLERGDHLPPRARRRCALRSFSLAPDSLIGLIRCFDEH